MATDVRAAYAPSLLFYPIYPRLDLAHVSDIPVIHCINFEVCHASKWTKMVSAAWRFAPDLSRRATALRETLHLVFKGAASW